MSLGSLRDGDLQSHSCHLLAFLSVNHGYSQFEFTLIVIGNLYAKIDNPLFFQAIDNLDPNRLSLECSLAR